MQFRDILKAARSQEELFQISHEVVCNSLADDFDPLLRFNIQNISKYNFEAETWGLSLETTFQVNSSMTDPQDSPHFMKRSAQFFRQFSIAPNGSIVKDFSLSALLAWTPHLPFLDLTTAKFCLKVILLPKRTDCLHLLSNNVATIYMNFQIALPCFLVENSNNCVFTNSSAASKEIELPFELINLKAIFPQIFSSKVKFMSPNLDILRGVVWPYVAEGPFQICLKNSSKNSF